MWKYEKRLQYPVNITRPNAEMAKVIISQFGGPDGEVGAAMRYLSQRYSNMNRKVAGVLTDIGTEELAHMEMICAIVQQQRTDQQGYRRRTAGAGICPILCRSHNRTLATGRFR